MLTWNKPYAPSNTGYPYLLPTSAAQRGARYIDGDHEIPCQKKSRVHNAVGIIVILGDLITALSLILVLFAPSYHFTTVVLLMGTVIHFDVGLFKIHVSSQSKRIFFIFKTEKTTNAINEAVAMLNGRSLAEFESYVCMSDGFLLSHISSNCSNATALRIASILFVLVYIVSAILLVAAAIIVGISMSRNILSKGLLIRMSYLLHLTPSFLTFFGCFMYIAIGGIDLRFVSNIPFLVQDVNFVDVGIGFFLAVATATLALVNPLFAYFLTHRTIEISPKDYFDNLEIEEAEDLVGLMRSAQDRNGGGYVPPPQTNMFPYYVIRNFCATQNSINVLAWSYNYVADTHTDRKMYHILCCTEHTKQPVQWKKTCLYNIILGVFLGTCWLFFTITFLPRIHRSMSKKAVGRSYDKDQSFIHDEASLMIPPPGFKFIPRFESVCGRPGCFECFYIYCERCETKDRRIVELEMRNNDLVKYIAQLQGRIFGRKEETTYPSHLEASRNPTSIPGQPLAVSTPVSSTPGQRGNKPDPFAYIQSPILYDPSLKVNYVATTTFARAPHESLVRNA